ncbi:MAG: hypothetical protein SOT58_07475 [Agathobacter sp.]|nr:hypothetical protein [Agathobacter sp.]
MSQKELVNELLKCHGTSLRQYSRELISYIYDDLFENLGLDYEVLGEVIQIVLEDANQYMKEQLKEKK